MNILRTMLLLYIRLTKEVFKNKISCTSHHGLKLLLWHSALVIFLHQHPDFKYFSITFIKISVIHTPFNGYWSILRIISIKSILFSSFSANLSWIILVFLSLFLSHFKHFRFIIFHQKKRSVMSGHLFFNGRGDIELPLLQHNIVRLDLPTKIWNISKPLFSSKINFYSNDDLIHFNLASICV